MVDPSTMLSAATFALSLEERAARRELQEQLGNGNVPPDVGATQNVEEEIRKLREVQEKNKPSPGDKDAYSSAVLELDPGETKEVLVEPVSGWVLRVKEVYFDRRDGHAYEINVAGDVNSVSHRAKYASPKAVKQSDRVVSRVTNESGTATTVDFELRAWAERTGGT